MVWMRMLCVATFSLLAVGALPMAARAQTNASGLVPETAIRPYGLERSWFTQIRMDRSQGQLSFLTQYVSLAKTYTVYEVTYEGKTIEYSERDVDRFGDPVGEPQARKLAEQKVDELKFLSKAPKLVKKNYPDVTICAQSDRGVLQVLDGETGRTRWVVTVGDVRHPSTQPAVNEKFVAVTHGSQLYVFDRESGKLAFERKVGGAPGAGPALGNELVYVPLVNGRVEAYQLAKPQSPPWIYQATGRALLQPLVTANTMSFTTDRGYMYVGPVDLGIIRYKFEAHDTVVATQTFAGPRSLFLASIDGYVYSVQEFTGEQQWRFSTGEPIVHPPVSIDGNCYVVTNRAGMYCVDSQTGEERWWTPQIRKFIGASKTRAYCLDETGRMIILDIKTGGKIGSLPTEQLDLTYTNWMTDRLYIGTKSGVLQCIHETGYTRPLMHIVASELPGIKPKSGDKKPAEGDMNPFGAGPMPPAEADPFGAGGAKPMAPEGDPFGAGGAAPAPMPKPMEEAPDPFK